MTEIIETPEPDPNDDRYLLWEIMTFFLCIAGTFVAMKIKLMFGKYARHKIKNENRHDGTLNALSVYRDHIDREVQWTVWLTFRDAFRTLLLVTHRLWHED